MDSSTPDFTAVANALAAPGLQPHTTFEALRHYADALVGAKMFTILVFNFAQKNMRRLYSTNTEIYPVGVDDPMTDSIWEKTLIGDRRPLVLNSPEAMATLLPNVPELVALGCEAMLNLPIVVAGRSLGAINILDADGTYTPERVERAKALVPAAAAIVLAGQLNGA